MASPAIVFAKENETRFLEGLKELLRIPSISTLPEHRCDIEKAANQALHKVFGKETVYTRSAGSIPIVGQFQDDLKIPSVMMGLGLPDDNIHAPNEKFHIPNFHKGIESLVRFLSILGGQ